MRRSDLTVVVVGASLAGVRSAEALRSQGFAGRIILVGDETDPPYDRPPLSKQLLTGAWPADRIALRPPAELTEKLDIDLRLGVRATALDLDKQTVATVGRDVSTEVELRFDGLVVATGARPRRLPGTEHLPNVHVLRTLADSRSLRAALVGPEALDAGKDARAEGRRLVVIGAGFIGAEAAASAHGLGADVVVLEALDVPLERQLGEEMARQVTAVHARHGVPLHTGVAVATVDGQAVVLHDGRRFPADAVVAGIGVVPNTEWLEGSGLTLGDGVVCDATCRAAPNVVAVGDVARWPHPDYDVESTIRVEHWTNAAEMAAHAATTLLADLTHEPARATAYAPVPYFWSDQYDAKIQFLGRATGFDEARVVAGDPASGKFLAIYRRGTRLTAALGVTMMRQLAGYRKLLAERASWKDALAHASTH